MVDQSELTEVGSSRKRTPLGWAFLCILVLSAFGVLWMVRFVTQLPKDMANAGVQVLNELEDIAQAFSESKVTHRFVSYTTEIAGTTFLQVATLEQVEVFDLEDSSSVLWGAVELPSVVVRATAPVTFTYYLNLNGEWDLEYRDGLIYVLAPSLGWNKPAVDASSIEYEIRKGSLLRDEELVSMALKQEITGRTAIRAIENIELVRETARRQAESFVLNWLSRNFSGGDRVIVELQFADEVDRGPEGAVGLSDSAVAEDSTSIP